MRFIVTGEWSRNRLLQVIVLLYLLFVVGLWVTNAALYLGNMGLTPASVVEYYLGSEERFLNPRSARAMLEISHFHLFSMGLLLLVLTHVMLFVPVANGTKLAMIVIPFVSALVDEGSGWLVRFVHPGFAVLKIAGFLTLQASLAALVAISLWAIFRGNSDSYRSGDPDALPLDSKLPD